MILERNYRCRRGEIDVIAQKDGYLVFVEVKYRGSERYGNPIEAVSVRKQRIISFVAMHYCACHPVSADLPKRFDVLAILGTKISLYVNAFPFYNF